MNAHPAAYIHEVRLLRKAQEISNTEMKILLGLSPYRSAPLCPYGKDAASMSDEDRQEAARILADWRKAHPVDPK